MSDLRSEEVWVSGTEEPDWLVSGTSEGDQEIKDTEDDERLIEQLGTRITDDVLYETDDDPQERMIINMGPQHPSTHGVLRLQLELEGEIVRRVKPIIGYLHTGMEKTAETLTYMQGPTNVTRMDYLAPLHNELCFSLAVEQLLQVEIPPRAQAIRILMTELNRVSSHLVALATNGMDVGALSMMLYGFRERELILAFFEKTTGLRMNHNFIRPGGVAADLPPGWEEDVAGILEEIPQKMTEYEDLLKANPIWLGRTRDVGVLTAEECLAYSVTGPALRATGFAHDLRKSAPYSGIDQYEFDVVTGTRGDSYDRYRVKVHEIEESLKIVKQVLETMPAGDYKTEDRKVTPPPRPASTNRWKPSFTTSRFTPRGSKFPRAKCMWQLSPHVESSVATSPPMAEQSHCGCTPAHLRLRISKRCQLCSRIRSWPTQWPHWRALIR